MRKLLMLLSVMLIGVFATSCGPQAAPEIGQKVSIPENTEALQVKQDKTGTEPCTLPAQEIEITRNTYWKTFLGSTEGYSTTPMSEVTVTNYGTCDKTRDVLILDEVLLELSK